MWETTLNPSTRSLIQLQLDGENDDDIVKAFMGKDTEFRKQFLTNVFEDLDVEELDV